MAQNYQRIGDYISVLDIRNTDGGITNLMGISIDKCYIPSVANVIGTDLHNYKVIRKGQFACSLMQVSRDQRIPLAMYSSDEPAIMSPAYIIFEVNRSNELLSEYMELWFKRAEFDREASFYAVGGVRGSLDWEDFCNMKIPVLPIDEQRQIVHDYQVITNRIELLRKINGIIESVCDSLFEYTTEAASLRGSSHLEDYISFENGKARPSTIGIIPVYGGNGIMAYTDDYNEENVTVIGRVGAYCGSVYVEKNRCWVSDNAIVAKSKVSEDEYFDYCLLKKKNLYNHHIGTGQQLLTQGILNAISCAMYTKDEICRFNQTVAPLFQNMHTCSEEIDKLEKLSLLLLSALTFEKKSEVSA